MSSRVSQIVLLCEDDEHRRLAAAYMKRCNINTDRVVVERVASQEQRGGNVGWVLDEFPRQLYACRQRHRTKAKTLLVVLVDADTLTIDERRRQLNERLKQAGYEELGDNDPVSLLIPRRHVETWFCCLLGQSVTEEEDCKGRNKLDKPTVRSAAATLWNWARPNAAIAAICVSSLRMALPQWRKIEQSK